MNLNLSENFRQRYENYTSLFSICKSSWLTIEIINYVQGIIDNNSIGDVWLDSFDLNEFSEQNNQRNDSAINEKKIG